MEGFFNLLVLSEKNCSKALLTVYKTQGVIILITMYFHLLAVQLQRANESDIFIYIYTILRLQGSRSFKFF